MSMGVWMGKFIDLTGQKFGKLTVLYRLQGTRFKNGTSKPVWHCQCECGNECNVAGTHLRTGHTKSCGCLHKETLSNNNKKLKSKDNIFDLTGKFGIGYTYNIDPTDPCKKRNYFYFDLEDYELIKNYCWSFNAEGYICAYDKVKSKNTFVRLHDLIMNCNTTQFVVDHIRHTKYDNRKAELRMCLNNENAFNKKPKENSKAIRTGIHFKNGKYKARLKCNGIEVLLQSFDTFEEAVAARKEAEDKYFGEFSYDNSMKLKTS